MVVAAAGGDGDGDGGRRGPYLPYPTLPTYLPTYLGR